MMADIKVTPGGCGHTHTVQPMGCGTNSPHVTVGGCVTSSTGAQGGQLYVVDVTNTGTGNVGNKKYVPNTVPANMVITEATTDDSTVTIHFMAEGGTFYSPTVTVDGIQCTNLQQYENDRRLFYGTVNIAVGVGREIVLVSSTGDSTSVIIVLAGAGPRISSVIFTGGYPTGQTEVKENDVFRILIDFDPTGSIPTQIEIDQFGACKSITQPVTFSPSSWSTNHSIILPVTIAATSTTATRLPVKCRARNQIGTFGSFVISNTVGTIDGINVVTCNDLKPSFQDMSTGYPIGQQAFKGTETGTQETLVQNFSSLEYSSPLNEFTIQLPAQYEQIKTITCRHPNRYNISQINFRIDAHRSQNATSSTFTKVIRVADTAPLVTITQPQVSLRSSPTGASYVIQALSTQVLLGSVTVSIPVSGTWVSSSFIGSGTIYTNTIIINDSDLKGSDDWSWNGTPPTNQAGIPASITGIQVVQGFIVRTLFIAAWPNRQVNIGTSVFNISKVRVENLSKGGNEANGGTLFLPSGDTDNAVSEYTILEEGVVDLHGSVWYNKDLNNAVSNTTGLAQIMIQEDI